jgi:hypothetical protein
MCRQYAWSTKSQYERRIPIIRRFLILSLTGEIFFQIEDKKHHTDNANGRVGDLGKDEKIDDGKMHLNRELRKERFPGAHEG